MSTYAHRGQALRVFYAAIACIVWMLTAGGRLRRSRTIILCYHGVTTEQESRFVKQMQAIAHRSISIDELHTSAARGQRPQVCVTLDDAFENVLRHALPHLKQFRVPATIFVVSDNLAAHPRWLASTSHPDRDCPVMSAEDVLGLSQLPSITIGSHTHTHRDLTQLNTDDLAGELLQSRHALESLAHRSIDAVALPHGRYNEAVFNAARAIGYQQVFTLDPANDARDEGIFGRMTMCPDTSMLEFHLTCAGAYDWLPCLRSIAHKLLPFKDLRRDAPRRSSCRISRTTAVAR